MENFARENFAGRRGLHIILAITTATILTMLAAAPQWISVSSEFEAGMRAPWTVRVSPLQPSPLVRPGSPIAIGRGEMLGDTQAKFCSEREPRTRAGLLLLLIALLASCLPWAITMRGAVHGNRFRAQVANAVVLVLTSAVSVLLLMFSDISALALPVGLASILAVQREDKAIAIAVGLLSSAAVILTIPGGWDLAAVVLAQGILPPLLLRRNAGIKRILAVSLVVAGVDALLYLSLYLAAWDRLPLTETLGLATWKASVAGPLASGILGLALAPLYIRLRGDVSRRVLRRLEKLSSPLLRDLANKAPGTWQHSLALAKLAETAGRSIHADIELLRVCAFYHDIGKMNAPKYFLENMGSNEISVQAQFTPEQSRDSIFNHVEGGRKIGRAAGLPAAILDGISSHHAHGLLEYFWTQQQLAATDPNAKPAAIEAFHYPGILPQSPELGILCICDAVEGAVRTLKNPSAQHIDKIVHRIVFGKLQQGQLSASGLTLKDLISICQALTLSLQEAHIDKAPNHIDLAALAEIRLDSHDRPSPDWKPSDHSHSSRSRAMIGHATTREIPGIENEDTALAIATPVTIDDLRPMLARSTAQMRAVQPNSLKDSAKSKSAEEKSASFEIVDATTTRGLRGPCIAENEPKSGPNLDPDRTLDTIQDAPEAVTAVPDVSESKD